VTGVHWPTALITAFGMLFSSLSSARAEGEERVVCWVVDGTPTDVASAARVRLARLGEVVERPPDAPPGPSPRAQQLQAEASATVERARALYYEASLDEAAEMLSGLLRLRGPALAESGSYEELRMVLLWLGASLAKGGHHDEAVEPFVFAIRLGLEEIDRSLFPPEVTRAFEAARAAAARAGTTSVTFVVRPEGATLEVDGGAAVIASGPATERELAAGRHVVVASRPGYRPVSEFFDVGVDATTIEMNLQPAGGELIADQISRLGRDGELDASNAEHIALVAQARSAGYVGVVGPGTGDAIALYDSSGRPTAWPVEPPANDEASAEPAGSETPSTHPDEPRPAWRRWWFWLALVGGAAVVGTGVGLGVHYGTQNRDTFMLVVEH